MAGQTELSEVLRTLQVSCDEQEYGFATTSPKGQVSLTDALCIFREDEGLTVIAQKDYLDRQGLSCDGTYAKLTIEVHTSLELVGLTAVLAQTLADSGISANVVAAYYHDHVFVSFGVRQKAIDVLLALKQ
jgi:uncharacterized protein